MRTELETDLAAMRAQLDRIEALISGARKTKAQRAAELGVSRSTLWRRQRKAARRPIS